MQQRTRVAVERDGRTALESVIARARELAPLGQDLPADVTLPDSLVFRDAGSRDVFSSLAQFAGISVAFDPQFRSTPLSVDLRGAALADALDAVTKSTSTFYKVTAPRTVTIVPDTLAKRREYDEEIIRTFYLSNADVKETIDLLRIVVDARRLSAITATNAISLRDTPERIAAAERLISGHRQGTRRGRDRRRAARDRPHALQAVRDADSLARQRRASPARSTSTRPAASRCRTCAPSARAMCSSPTCRASTTGC